jgi:hypothetical protein
LPATVTAANSAPSANANAAPTSSSLRISSAIVERQLLAAPDDGRQADGERDGDDAAHARRDHPAREQRGEDEQRRDPRQHEEERDDVLLAELGDQLRGGVPEVGHPTSSGIDVHSSAV